MCRKTITISLLCNENKKIRNYTVKGGEHMKIETWKRFTLKIVNDELKALKKWGRLGYSCIKY